MLDATDAPFGNGEQGMRTYNVKSCKKLVRAALMAMPLCHPHDTRTVMLLTENCVVLRRQKTTNSKRGAACALLGAGFPECVFHPAAAFSEL